MAISYDALLADGRGTAARLAGLIGPAAHMPEDGQADEIDRLVDRGLRHHATPDGAGLEAQLERIMAEAHAAFLALQDRDDAAARARIDAMAAAWRAQPRLLDDIIHDELRHRRFEALRLRAPAGAEGDPTPPRSVDPAPDPQPSDSAHDVPPPPPAPLAEQIATIRDSGLFDSGWYRDRYPDAAASGIDPIEHYLTVGAAQGHDPGPLFQTGYYARQMVRRIAGGADGSR